MSNEKFGITEIKLIIKYYCEHSYLPSESIDLITEGEWQSFLDNIDEYFSQSDQTDYTVACNIIVRRAINLAQMDNNVLSFYYVIMALSDLKVFQVSEENINELKNKIMFNALKNNAEKTQSKTKNNK